MIDASGSWSAPVCLYSADVLVMRPEKHNKLELMWKGPYHVIERLGEVDYKIQMEWSTKIFHANLLKLCIEREDDDA